MAEVKTDAIVLRHVDFGESNRMLTLLSPVLGKLSVSARGCRRRGARRNSILNGGTADEKGENRLCRSRPARL